MATESSTERKSEQLVTPRAEELLEGVTRLAREFHLEVAEDELVARFLEVVRELFPGRRALLRVLDVRSSDPARLYGDVEAARDGVAFERLTIKKSSVDKTRLKTAIAESARLRTRERWDSPFAGLAAGFAIPLVASGELYGLFDLGYPLGEDRGVEDEPLVLPLVNQLSVALRNERLHRDTTSLRDYQAKLIEHANALIVGIDRRWRVVVCNQALCQVIGLRRDELIGHDVRDHLLPLERARLTPLLRDAFAGDESSGPVEFNLRIRGGGVVRTVWSVAPIRKRGEVHSVVAVGQDQTRLRQLQSQVIQAEKLATLGQLAAGVVHELNNPLTSISVYAHYLLERRQAAAAAGDADADDEIEKLRRIGAGAQRILDFARDLVQYAKPAGETADAVSLNSVVQQSLSFCEHLFERAEVRLVQDLAPDLPAVHAVPGQLEQVVINLVTNAVQACNGGGAVTVATRVDGGQVVVSVGDTGPGIDAADRARIFEPFFSTKSDGEGTGLGLSIVKNILEQHGGSVTVGCEPGQGAVFRCCLPAHAEVSPGGSRPAGDVRET